MPAAPAQAATRRLPSRVRFAGFIMLFVYPLVTTLQAILLPLTQGWPLPARTAVFVPIMVVCMVWGIIPFIQTRLHRYL
ncbi:hypothetical protein [Pseudogemmobacter blasticus]|uniref:Uncharacterized protein n=1 Tax=Fuscovulum blasticum DSM 2131 TaxID=1188250 RepID=A0A2T4J538_FUSBL|nr:hypothetical protein [Fuscovulum blasticum]AWD22929.1 hypothetical protein B6K69_15610 [Fuscovulum blasticum]PTE13016.1 hypothetical protein C5F44_15705 [Fuscovulum blasticum DSM 2131]